MARVRSTGLVTIPVLVAALVAGCVLVGSSSTAADRHRPAVIEMKIIGHSVKGRPIYAWRVGNPKAKVTAVAMAVMHGDETAPRRMLRSIRDGRKVRGIDLWLLPTVNPDGRVRHSRHNARGVDLNRNYPFKWARLHGNYNSGPRPGSEPETRALMRFFTKIKPDLVVSFHQPLHGVDTSVPKARPFAFRLARFLHLPRKRLVCGGVCHGTFTEWFMHRFDGLAVTVEYGDHPGPHKMHVTAPRQLLRALGAHR
jgi:murein peptide amidase A